MAEDASKSGFTVIAICADASVFEHNDNVLAIDYLDMSTRDDRQRLARLVRETLDDLDAVLYSFIHASSIVRPGNVEWLDPEEYETVLQHNYHTPVGLVYELLPLLKKSRGRFITISNSGKGRSWSGSRPLPTTVTSAVAKNALDCFCDVLRSEMVPFGVKVISVDQPTLLHAGTGTTTTKTRKEIAKTKTVNKTELETSSPDQTALTRYAEAFREIHDKASATRQIGYDSKQWLDAYLQHHQRNDTSKNNNNKTVVYASVDSQACADDVLRALTRPNPPSRICTEPSFLRRYGNTVLQMLPLSTLDRISFGSISTEAKERWYNMQVRKPPALSISHVTIVVSDLAKAVRFYRRFGLEPIDVAVNGDQFLQFVGIPRSRRDQQHDQWDAAYDDDQHYDGVNDDDYDDDDGHYGHYKERYGQPKNNNPWTTLVLLKEDSSLQTPRPPSHGTGMHSLVFAVENIVQELERLKSKSIHPVRIEDTSDGFTATYRDPDGFLVSLVQFRSLLWIWHRYWASWSSQASRSSSVLLWSINVENYTRAAVVLQRIGFEQQSYSSRAASLLSVSDNSKTRRPVVSRLLRLPHNDMSLLLAKWGGDDKPKRLGHQLINTVSIAVYDMKATLLQAIKAGMVVRDLKGETKELPYYGSVKVGTAFLEDGTNRIEFVQF